MLPNHQIFVTSCVKKLQCDPLWSWNFNILFWNTKWMLLRIGWWWWWWCFFCDLDRTLCPSCYTKIMQHWASNIYMLVHHIFHQHIFLEVIITRPIIFTYLYHPPLPTLISPTFPLPGAWWVDIQVCEVAAAVGVRPQCGAEIWIYHLFRNW